jgi:hypothetical protein
MFEQQMFTAKPRIMVVPGGYMEPKRKHTKRRWMEGRAYHKRIQKKWLRRFGQHWIETLKRGEVLMDKERNTIMCRAEDATEIRGAPNDQAHQPQKARN